MKVLILGGDGYLGWPTAMYLSRRGHDVHLVDNYLRRRVHTEAGSGSLTPIAPDLETRVTAWREVTGATITMTEGDLTEWSVVEQAFKDFPPDAIVHYGEIPAAPYSMKDRARSVLTQYNNVVNTLNVLWAMHEFAPDTHLVKLGTMGEYGTPNIDIEEGWLEVNHNGRQDRLPFPKLPGSFYHCSKVHDSTNIEFACRAWGIRATDLNQGVVYGIETEETKLDPRLATRFDYDEIWGTALNRFCVQAVIGQPLTVYGKGGQTRGFLNILDTLQCVELTAANAPAAGEFRVYNQFTEVFSVADLAEKVRHAGEHHGMNVRVDNVPNPRVEAEEHYYNPIHTKLPALGLQPTLLSENLIESTLVVIERYKDRVIPDVIAPSTAWRPAAAVGQPAR
jgi:UDP-sulfoquinovose synthase